MTTTTIEPSVVDDVATVLGTLADLDFAEGRACEWTFKCPEDDPAPAVWFAITVQLPCSHEQTDWLVCGRCLAGVLVHRRHGCAAVASCSSAGCGATVPLSDWLVSYRPIEQPAWSKGGGSRG